MGKTKRGLKPSSSSKAVAPKQKRQRWAKLSAQSATELSGNQRNCMYCLSQNENSCYSSKYWRIHLFERNIVENKVLRLLNESWGKNLLLNERSKTLMLQIGQIGNKYPFDAWKKWKRQKESTPFNANTVSLCENTSSKSGDLIPLLVIL